MSLSLTYDDIVSAMQTWAEDNDTDYVAEIPKMIGRAESRCLRDLDLQMWEGWVTVTISASDAFIDKPDDVVIIDEIWYRSDDSSNWGYVLRRTQSFCRAYWRNEGDEADPEYFAEIGEAVGAGSNSILLVPTPGTTYTGDNAKALCTIRPTALASGNQSTWLSTHVGDLLFEACMVEAYDYLKHPAKLEEAANKYQSLLPSLQREVEATIRRRYSLGD